MGYELSNGDKNFSVQDLANIVGQQALTVDTMIKGFSDMAKKQDRMSNKIDEILIKQDEFSTRVDNIENKEEIKEEQKDVIKRLAGRKVIEVLGLPLDIPKRKWTDEQKAYYNLYSGVVYGALYTEVRAKGHLAGRLGATSKGNYKEAISDIEGWYPSCGLETLKRKAEKDRVAKLEADRMALERTGRA